MSNHPGRKPRPRQMIMSPAVLSDLIAMSDITQERAANLAGVALRTMSGYLTGSRKMPRSASGLLCLSLINLGAPRWALLPWLHPDVAAELGLTPHRRS